MWYRENRQTRSAEGHGWERRVTAPPRGLWSPIACCRETGGFSGASGGRAAFLPAPAGQVCDNGGFIPNLNQTRLAGGQSGGVVRRPHHPLVLQDALPGACSGARLQPAPAWCLRGL